MKISNSFVGFKNNFRQTEASSNYKIRFADAHRVLNDSLMQDSIAINLAQEIASAKAGKTHINIEDFVKNVLDTFTFSVKASSFKKHLEQIDEVDGQGFYIQRPDEDVFIPSKPQTEFDKRLKILKDYLKVDLDAVSPEVLEAFRKLNPEALKLLPDSLISAVLKKCSDYNSIFLDSDMPMEEKLQAFQKGKDNSAEKEEYNDFDVLIQKQYAVKDLCTNLFEVTSLLHLEDLQAIFEKNEKGRFIHKKAIATFQDWLLSSPGGGYYSELLFELRNAKTILF